MTTYAAMLAEVKDAFEAAGWAVEPTQDMCGDIATGHHGLRATKGNAVATAYRGMPRKGLVTVSCDVPDDLLRALLGVPCSGIYYRKWYRDPIEGYISWAFFQDAYQRRLKAQYMLRDLEQIMILLTGTGTEKVVL